MGGFLNTAPEVWLMLDSITGDIELSTKAANVGISCRESGNIDIKTGKGNVNINASQSISMVAPLINLWGKVNVNGTLMAEGVNVNSHIHLDVQPGNGESGPVKGSGAESDEDKFERIKQDLRANNELSIQEQILLCIPDIATAMASRQDDPYERRGWLYLHEMMIKWLSGSKNTNATMDKNPYWIEWDWVMGLQTCLVIPTIEDPFNIYTSPKQKYEAFIRSLSNVAVDEPKANIHNTNAKKMLAQILVKAELMPQQVGEIVHFDFTPKELWPAWEDYYYTLRRVPQPAGINGQQAALGSFTLRALAKGWIKKTESKYEIHVTGVSIFVHDVYNFADDGVQWLGFWSCKYKDVVLYLPSGDPQQFIDYASMYNQIFRNYQNTYSYGGDYLVLSEPHHVEDFKEIVYNYPL